MNLANKITLFRVFLVPIFVIVLFSELEYATYIAGLIFVIASITDAIDGYIARSRNLVTNFGKFVDPLADKVLTASAFISLVELGKIPAWAVVIIIAREFTITGFRTLAVSAGITIAASHLGKFKTITQILSIILLLFDNIPFNFIGIPMDIIMFYLAVIMTIISGVDYLLKNKQVLNLKDI